MVERLFLTVPRGCLRFVIVVFPDHTHLLFWTTHQDDRAIDMYAHSLVSSSSHRSVHRSGVPAMDQSEGPPPFHRNTDSVWGISSDYILFYILGLKKVKLIYESAHEISVLYIFVSNECSGEPAQMCRLTRAFAACIHKVWVKMKTQTKFRLQDSMD